VLTEILKNAFRATVEHHHKKNRDQGKLPPVEVTISQATLPLGPSDVAGDKILRVPPSFLTIRVRDQGGGVDPKDLKNIFSYAFTTARGVGEEDEGSEGGPYAAQAVGGIAAIAHGGGGNAGDSGNLFGEIIGKGLQTGLGTIAGLGYGYVSRLF
jgi:26S proteasome regulatory subunit T1